MKQEKYTILKRYAVAWLLGAVVSLSPAAFGQVAGNCCITFDSGQNGVTMVVSLPWAISLVANHPDYSSADNPSYLTEQVTVGNPTVSVGSYIGWFVDVPADITQWPTTYGQLLFQSIDPI